MLNYAVCEIAGKQYKIIPGRAFEIDLQKESGKDLEVNVLLLSEDGKLKIGSPYLKEKLALTRLEDGKGKKIRVSKFHAKANYRRTIGFRSKTTKVIWSVKKA
ncbi:50S ribosomal protein L21 [Candidatus Daviesbacteria bacterium RIFCSPLOWO2_02_FULL_41_8]|uniref:50S ribosomal protein L21 n=3 Tax=Candidatus Daviesiibacteriota TaxID=1752718 RepID=A0A1F5NLT5_9BACT|nr:MAG: 50S ribosomal protein L21 [Candidatus Daviesbacteria bacterium RIFCSPHIGHO2_01_FULL_41_23]OGE32458.1 MAG: 50S ribosomal protein L21 [Candidatus Daviesbacteria bacterium RIFCSPHIGHO2_02_FULL_41_10]OGE61978.1 MAG: 50S ribosomal protein L21 [Candidatus Daviesbacteria bacterium RIFCSPLOWO2_01_FULL_41_32]OGE78503.1 MAG: 50S ribosomal protein L21 [Candidatus Daviesbacteria bacterium RIFCSPLOWO2_02_FULL_41_8]